MRLKLILSAAILTIGRLCSYADTLDTSRIEADRDKEAAATSPLRVISASDTHRRGTLHLHEAVRSMAGVSIRDYGGTGGLKTVSVRNMGASHTTLSYDGFAISDIRNGQPDISRYSIDDIEEISVSIGHDDDIFKSARLMEKAGILQIVSKKPVFEADLTGIRKTNITARFTAGSFGTYNPYVRCEQRISDVWAVSADAGWLISKGNYPFRLDNGRIETEEIRKGSEVNTINARTSIYGNFLNGGKADGKIIFSRSSRGLPGSVRLYTPNPSEHLDESDILAAFRYEATAGSSWRYSLGASYSASATGYTNTDAIYSKPQNDSYMQQEAALSLIVQYNISKRMKVAAAQDVFANFLTSDIPENRSPKRVSSITAVSAGYNGRRLKITASAAGAFISETCDGTESAPPDRKHISPSFGISYALLKDKSLRIRASYKNTCRIPTFNDLYYARTGNTSLRPEKASQFNAGLTWTGCIPFRNGKCTFEMTADAYTNFIKDRISAIPTMFIWKMYNIGKVRTYGSEITIKGHLHISQGMDIFLSGGYVRQKSTDVTDPSSKTYGHQTAYVPEHSGNISASVVTAWGTLSYTASFMGKRYSLGQNIMANLMEAFDDHSLSLSHSFKISRHMIDLGIQARNITDVNYEIIRYYPMPGRNYRITLKYIF